MPRNAPIVCDLASNGQARRQVRHRWLYCFNRADANLAHVANIAFYTVANLKSFFHFALCSLRSLRLKPGGLKLAGVNNLCRAMRANAIRESAVKRRAVHDLTRARTVPGATARDSEPRPKAHGNFSEDVIFHFFRCLNSPCLNGGGFPLCGVLLPALCRRSSGPAASREKLAVKLAHLRKG